MNKKFSTLLAGVALLGAMSASAQKAVDGLVIGANSGLYQIAVGTVAGNDVLSMDENGELSIVTAGSTGYEFENTLWCVTVAAESEGQNPKYDFLNKKTGQLLDFSKETFAGKVLAEEEATDAPITVGGEVKGWAFSKEFGKLQKGQPLFSYFTNDSVVGLSKNSGKLALMKAGASKVTGLVADADNKFLPFTLQNAAAVRLSAKNINSILGLQAEDKGVKLTFTPDEKGVDNMKGLVRNPFSINKFFTEPLDGTDTDAADYVRVYTKDGDKKNYLAVDTAYTNQSGVKFLAFKWAKQADMEADLTYAGQYKFAFTYYPSIDSLVIQAKEVSRVKNDVSYKYWKDVAAGDIDKITATLDDFASTKGANNFVTVQDLLKDQIRIITIADKKESNVSLGFKGCMEIKSSKTSVADGVYYIKNRAGKYLASPIYKNGEIIWTTVNEEEQNVADMPAYQWVVLKKNVSSSVAATSPVVVTNREFDKKYSVQLNKAEGASYMYLSAAVDGELITVKDSLLFVAVPEASVKDSLLGYKKLGKDELMVNKFTFNYWHPYATDKFIAKSSKDSILTVFEGKSAFLLDTLVETANLSTVNIPFGYDVKAKGADKRIKGLKQLHRTVYSLALDKAGWGINNEDKFNVSTYNNAPVYFFKENNEIDGKCYYAIVSATKSETETEYVIDDATTAIKAGVSDYDGAATLKSQLLNETRTSAFYIAPDNAPLYRRFNSAVLEGNDNDKRDTLRFYEQYRNEYLQVETNINFKGKDVDFLGIYTADKSKGGLAFLVDTAWVNRGFGNVKPQYLISIDRHDHVGTPGSPCTEAGPHIDADGKITDDPSKCVHAQQGTLGFQRGMYLINFHDVALMGQKSGEVNDDYMWKKYDRAGFVDAIRVADTLWVLRSDISKLPNEKITLAAIQKSEAAAKAAAEKANVVFKSYKYVLAGDNHKYVTWSMRFKNKEVAANEKEEDRAFLFESMKSAGQADIAPVQAAWLKMQNGCLVLSTEDSKFDEITTGADDALIFNVKHVEDDKIATDTEIVDGVNGVAVSTDKGTVTVKNAAGKSVVITNILGQNIVNAVAGSSSVTYSVPAGVITVSVDGVVAGKMFVK